MKLFKRLKEIRETQKHNQMFDVWLDYVHPTLVKALPKDRVYTSTITKVEDAFVPSIEVEFTNGDYGMLTNPNAYTEDGINVKYTKEVTRSCKMNGDLITPLYRITLI